MADILSLVPKCGTVAPKESVADDPRILADSIEAGDWGEVCGGMLVLRTDETVMTAHVGMVLTSLEAVGALELAKSSVMWPDDSE